MFLIMSKNSSNGIYIPKSLQNLAIGQKLSLAGIVITIFGSFLPWLSATILGAQFTVRGIDRDGKFTLLVAIMAGVPVILYWNKRGQITTAILGLFVAGLALLYVIDPLIGVPQSQMSAQEQSMLRSAINIEIGLYVTVLGGTGIAYGSLNDIFKSSEIE